ncbi:MAG: amidohydrolase family protein, partial [Deltaproteobacteria bacterium]|nr:amidohydrolase family protein [Deltaproteobacteria bacterium]
MLGLLAAVAAGCAPAEEPANSGGDASGGDSGNLILDVAGQLDGAPPGDSAADMQNSDQVGPAPDRYLLVGTLVTPTEHFAGQLLAVGATITCAEPGTACEQRPDAAGAHRIETKGLILPGLIDMHNHILFDIFDDDDWLPAKSYLDHNEWPKEARYAAMLDVKQCLENASQGKPTWCMAPYNTKEGNLKCEMDKWGELKGLIAGTTSIVGLAGTTAPCFASVARTIDASQNGLTADKVQTSALFPPSTAAADGVCKNFAKGTTAAYLIHCGEGINDKAKAEFATLNAVSTEDGCLLAPGTVITHGTAFDPPIFATMASTGVKLTWSPASNVALYGSTTDIPSALAAGVVVSLGPDWSMGGSQNMLDELRFADGWDNSHWSNHLTPKDLLKMATVNAAQSLGLGDQ